MNNKDKYIGLMQRYWEAQTTPEEERDLALYVAANDDPDFNEIRGVLGYLSVGREKHFRKRRAVPLYYYLAFAASVVAAVMIGFGLDKHAKEHYSLYAYGEFSSDHELVMSTVDTSLEDFFGGTTPAENNLIEIFKR